jgi:hypothetical protein
MKDYVDRNVHPGAELYNYSDNAQLDTTCSRSNNTPFLGPHSGSVA